MSLKEVFITRTAAFLPNEPISNDEMETYLGFINEQASKSRRIVLRNNGIKNRHYAMTKNGEATHTNAQLAAIAVEKLFEKNPNELKEIDVLSCGTSSPDQLMPSHGVMVHGWLTNSNNIEVISPSGNCCSGMHALKYNYMAIKAGEAHKTVSTGSERLSRIMRAEQFELEVKKREELEENPYISFEKDFLRWMLSDGSAAFLIEDKKNEEGISLRIDWIEGFSFANQVETCMYMGSEKQANGELKGFSDFTPQEAIERSIYSIKQDVKLLGENIVKLGFKNLEVIFKNRGIDVNMVDHFLPHMSSYFFEDKIYNELKSNGMEIPKEKWFTNLENCGNVGAASVYLMVDELWKSGKLNIGDTILVAVPESARFTYVFAMFTVV